MTMRLEDLKKELAELEAEQRHAALQVARWDSHAKSLQGSVSNLRACIHHMELWHSTRDAPLNANDRAERGLTLAP